jgi:hypothetical protein
VDYGSDIMARRRRRKVPEIEATPGLVVEDAGSGFCGAVIRVERDAVVLEDRHGNERTFRLRPAAFRYEGKPATLIPVRAPAARRPARSASGSVRKEGLRARQARASRIWVEGLHDAELVERVWGHDLRVEGVVVEQLHGVDDLPEVLADFRPGPGRRVGVLVDHLVAGSKESRLVARVTSPDVLVTGHPYVDIWQAVKPAALGLRQWPAVPRGVSWKDGVCAALGWGAPADGWRRVLAAVSSFRDIEAPLIGAVEQLIDFVTAEDA